MVRLLLTRHGQTKQNVEGIIQGKENGDVNDKGFRQIKNLISRLKKEKIRKIISSDLQRCKITTEEIIKEIDVPVLYTSLIREKDNGEWVGKKNKEAIWDDLIGKFETRRAPNGENLREVRKRGREFTENILMNYKNSDETILIVSHGAFLKAFIGDLLGMSLYDSIFKLFIEHCSLTELEINDKHQNGYRFNFINEKNYLRAL